MVTLLKTSDAIYTATNACFGQPVLFTNNSDSTNVLTYEWKFGDGADSTDSVWVDTISHGYNGWGHYNSLLVVKDSNGCSDTMKKQVTIYKLPLARIVSPITGCARDIVQFSENSTVYGGATISKYQWDFGDPMKPDDIGIIENATHIYDSAGTYHVMLKITDNHSCSDTTLSTVTVNPSPTSAFTYSDYTPGIPGKLLMENQSSGATGYKWDFGNGQTSQEENPIVTYSQDGTYIIKLISNNQLHCTDTTFYKYEVLFRGLFIPNAFSPSSSNIAIRLFKPVGINIKEYHIQVFDNWGHQMWESTAKDAQGRPSEGWDGTFNGQPAQQGTYMWKASAIFIDDSIWQGSDIGQGKFGTYGTVTLLR
jgi:PKD repeat protein